MSQTRIDTFTSSGTWICPAGVSAVWATLIGGGSGAVVQYCPGPGHPPYEGRGGGGSGEMLIGVPMKVTPGASYSVVIGAGGPGATAMDTNPGPAGDSTFNGFRAYGSPGYGIGLSFYRETVCGGGGGWGGCCAMAAGYIDSGTFPGARCTPSDAHVTGRREGWWGTGGNRGGQASNAGTLGEYATSTNFDKTENHFPAPGSVDMHQIGGVSMGDHPYLGLANPADLYWTSGGAGGGSIFGGSIGCDYTVPSANANPVHYGSGAPGGGNNIATGPIAPAGGDGAPGIVQIMYIN